MLVCRYARYVVDYISQLVSIIGRRKLQQSERIQVVFLSFTFV